ncbi:MAG: 23S rRNA (uracil(1939)-C(5))-methyltransferase RlmD [Firmicutes bacterium]|nr:23S rRNA (uracil(1939)-C(5))-methyltransferase RlmD [Bacillota bacterium]MBQ6841917.1 23S rRNA (uracil(1939)-C(5))-methyltransferase RlmD [Bacillota bacterium]MBR7114219.1 23S rRNA (uracil(1939)-C(5))-methyltransferase RlmD [Bacillota bacterium]
MAEVQNAVKLHIDNCTLSGDGVARLDGQAVFVPGALPGEEVEAVITQRKKSYARARLTQVLQPHPRRNHAACPQAARCGGCPLAMADYPLQLQIKQQAVADLLRRMGGFAPDAYQLRQVMPSPKERGYRCRVALHWQPRTQELGFYAESSHQVIPAAACGLLSPLLADLTVKLQQLLPQLDVQQLRHIVLQADADDAAAAVYLVDDDRREAARIAAAVVAELPQIRMVWGNSGKAVYGVYGSSWYHLQGLKQLPDRVGELQLLLSPGAFTQVNVAQRELLYRTAIEAAGVRPGMRLLDAYSGVGVMALLAAQLGAEVIGIESYAPAAEDAAANARLNGLARTRFIADTVEKAAVALAAEGYAPEAVILDPPRAGCDMAALQAVLQMRPQRIVYVSCDPATLARDLKVLAADKYRLSWVQPLDMFPGCGHIENIACLDLNADE